MTYGKYKQAVPSAARKIAPPLPLTHTQQAHAERMKALWQKHFPGDSFLRDLLAAGMIDGYRNIISITPNEANHGTA